MPELPEVETTKQGIKPHLEGHKVLGVIVRNPKLRVPVPENISELCAGKKIKTISRRAKYILVHLSEGYLLIHLGMSGHLRVLSQDTPAEKHDHIDLIMTNGLMLRYCDPRRFGLFIYVNDNPQHHSLLSHLGPEPLSDGFTSDYLFQRAQGKSLPIKAFIMSNEIVVGVGNIYATESLFLAGIHPQTPAKNISLKAYQQLTEHIKKTLQLAIEAGGTTLRDFYTFDGKPGYFSISLKVYGRKNQPCFQCATPIDSIIIGGRNSTFCPNCQLLCSLQ